MNFVWYSNLEKSMADWDLPVASINAQGDWTDLKQLRSGINMKHCIQENLDVEILLVNSLFMTLARKALCRAILGNITEKQRTRLCQFFDERKPSN
jgi:hypothetical protein